MAFSNLLNYAGQHAPPALLLWLISLAGAWIFYGSELSRPRQNLSTKVSFLVKLGITGVIIDNIVSLYQFEDSSQEIIRAATTTAIIVGLAERTLFYLVIFSAVALLSFIIGRNQNPVVTPPPRFGRE